MKVHPTKPICNGVNFAPIDSLAPTDREYFYDARMVFGTTFSTGDGKTYSGNVIAVDELHAAAMIADRGLGEALTGRTINGTINADGDRILGDLIAA